MLQQLHFGKELLALGYQIWTADPCPSEACHQVMKGLLGHCRTRLV